MDDDPPRHPNEVRRTRRLTRQATAAFAVAGACVVAALCGFESPQLLAIVFVAAALFGTLALFARVSAPPGLVLAATARSSFRGGIGGRQLALDLVQIDAMGDAEHPPLSSFIEEVGEGAARHDPVAVRRSVNRALSRSGELRPETAAALESLGQALDALDSSGARCCLVLTNAWSGAIETNLGLFFVAS